MLTRQHANNLDLLDIAKRKVRDQVSVEYSYDQIRDFGERHRRDVQRRREVEEIFAGLMGESDMEETIFAAYQRRLADTREHYLFSGHIYYARQYTKLKADPERYAKRLVYKRDHKRVQRKKVGPGYARGERSGGAKLTEASVVDIITSDMPGSALAKKHGVSPALVSGIRSGQKWQHVHAALREARPGHA